MIHVVRILEHWRGEDAGQQRDAREVAGEIDGYYNGLAAEIAGLRERVRDLEHYSAQQHDRIDVLSRRSAGQLP